MQLSRRHLLAGMLAAAPSVGAVARVPDWAPPAPERELRVPVRGGRIYVRVNGDLAAPRAPAIFIHGGPGSNHAYLTTTLPLADERAVILYDQLDSGLSDHPNDPGNWTVERFVSELDAIRVALDLKRLHVVGHSWGGTIALEYGARRPGGLRSLTLSSPLISTRSWQASAEAQLATLPTTIREAITTHERDGTTQDPAYAKAMAIFYAHFGQRTREPDYLSSYEERLNLRENRDIYRTMWGAGEIYGTGTLRDYDGEPLLPRISVPTLVTCGEYDEFTPAAAGPLVARIPHARLVSIPGAGHDTMVDQQQFYLRVLRTHFAQADAAA